ncbi:UNVERIFIED_CONTAM: hypothetical protein Sangu_2962900 [Sesamum angustifolium]|uniref:Uncharacterized protein n=1 Tax=Sesamum angustifolium TaxID=2727405 RepID=A0AAW2IK61_9LAMI
MHRIQKLPIFAEDTVREFTQWRDQAVVVNFVAVLEVEFTQLGNRVPADSVENRHSDYQNKKLWAEINAIKFHFFSGKSQQPFSKLAHFARANHLQG